MKPSLLDKLQNLAHRLEEVTALLGSPEATANMDNYRKLNQEHAELTPIVETYHAYTQAQSDLADAQEMLSDPEMKDFATEEIENAKTQIEQLDFELQKLLLPKMQTMTKIFSLKFAQARVAMKLLYLQAIY